MCALVWCTQYGRRCAPYRRHVFHRVSSSSVAFIYFMDRGSYWLPTNDHHPSPPRCLKRIRVHGERVVSWLVDLSHTVLYYLTIILSEHHFLMSFYFFFFIPYFTHSPYADTSSPHTIQIWTDSIRDLFYPFLPLFYVCSISTGSSLLILWWLLEIPNIFGSCTLLNSNSSKLLLSLASSQGPKSELLSRRVYKLF